MASVDTRYPVSLSVSMPDRPAVAGADSQAGRAGSRQDAGIDWFSPARIAEYQPVTVRASTAVTVPAALDALAGNILSHIGEYTPD